MDKLLSAVASLVAQHLQVYNKRQCLQRKKYKLVFAKDSNGRYLGTTNEWWQHAMENHIDLEALMRYTVRRRGSYTTDWYKSARSKKATSQARVEHIAWLQANGYSVELPDRQLAEIEATPVYPFAKQLNAYIKVSRQLRTLDRKQNNLRTTLQQLNKLNLGLKVTFGSGHYAHDRITSITIGERTMKPKEFLEHVEFESKVLA